MGLLRLLFALSIVIFHIGGVLGYYLLNREVAVLSFFIISGFYMALVLERKYVKKNKEYLLFITNRFLRIYPLYLLILAITVLFTLAKFLFPIGTPDNAILHYVNNYAGNPHGFIFLDITNVILRNLTLIITTDYLGVDSRAAGYLIIPQAWTLQIELLFYLVIPFIIWRNIKVLVGVVIAFLLLFFYLQHFQATAQYNLALVFLHHLLYFLLGIISFYLFRFIEHKNISRAFLKYIFIFYLIYLLAYNSLTLPFNFTFDTTLNFLHYIIFTAVLPFIFLYSQKNKLDQILGELSYPIYISHILIIKIVSNSFLAEKPFAGLIAIALTLIVSIGLIRFIEMPIEVYRQRRLSSK